MGLYKGNPTWREDVYQVEVDDPVVGGDVQWRGEEATSGYSNAASQQLADRTTYLKEELESLERGIRNEVETQESASIQFEGAGIAGNPLRANLKDSLDTIAWVRKDNTFTKDNFFRGVTEVEDPNSVRGAVNKRTLESGLAPKADKTYVDSELTKKQDNLVAGTNIQINQSTNVISATDTKYTAGNGLTLSGATFSLPVTKSGTGTFVKSVDQNANGVTITLDTPPDTTYNPVTTTVDGLMSSADKVKLNGIATGATKNATDSQLRDRTTHTGEQPMSSVTGLQTALDSKVGNDDPRLSNPREWTASVVTQAEAEAGTATTARKWTAQRVRQAILGWWAGSAEKTKLDGIATGATKNTTDAQLRDRTTHTGVQPISTVSGLQSALDSKVNNTDPRLSDAREWTASTVSQAEAEAGTAITRRAFTAQRVRQAIAAWWLTASTLFGRSLVESSDASDAKTKLGLSTVATSGSYNDLSNKPTIPTVPALMPQAEATTGTATTQRTINAKVLKDTIDASVTTATNPLQPKLTAGTNVQISADNVISSTNTTYAGMSSAEIDAGTSTTTRSISSKVLNDWLNGKGYSTQTLVAGSNVSISGNTISAVNTTYAGMTQAEADAGTLTAQRLISPKVLVDTISSAVSGGVSADALIKAQNLNDLPNKATARNNLGLGSAATRNVGTGSGNVMEVGAFGLGSDMSSGGGDSDPLSPTGFRYNAAVGFFLNVRYTPTVAGFRLSNTPYTNSFFLENADNSNKGTFKEKVLIYHSGNFNPDTKANTSTQVIAGNGLSGGGTLAANRTVTLGTPSTITSTTTNAVTATSHTHEIVVTKSDVGLGNVLNVASYSKTESDARYYTQTTADSRYAYKAGDSSQDFSAKDAAVTKLKFGTNAEMVYNSSSKTIDFIFS